jgi:apolipoprotein N-acyltransferase
VALVPLLVLARDLAGGPQPVRAGLGCGLLAGFGFFAPLLWWLEQIGVAAWLLLSLAQAVSVAVFVAALAGWGSGRARPVVAAVVWVALEAVRMQWPLGGFGWGLLGYTQHGGGPYLELARTVGVLGVSAALAATAAGIEALLVRLWRVRPARQAAAGSRPGAGRRLARAAWAPVLGLAGVGAAVWLLAVPAPTSTGETVDIAAVQGNDLRASAAAGAARVSRERIVRVSEQMLAATRPLAANPPEITVWPENAVDTDITEPGSEATRARVADALELLDGGALLAGVLTDGPRPQTLYNTTAEVTAPDELGQVYRKRQLVPFGEYIPARRWLDWFPGLGQIPSDILGGGRSPLIELAGARLGTAICFENTFPGLVRSQVRRGAEAVVVSTNNASFGPTAMSRQHLAFSQLRAVESGRWVLHAGISGISGLVDPGGDVSQRTELYQQALVRDQIPLVEADTPYVRLGDVVGTAAMVLFAGGLVMVLGRAAVRRRRSGRGQSV